MRKLHVGDFVVYRDADDAHIKKGYRGTVCMVGRKTLVVDFEDIGRWEVLAEEIVLLEKLDALMPCCGVAIPEESNKYGTAFEVYSYSVCGEDNAAYFEGIDVSGEEFSINMDYWSLVVYDAPSSVITPKAEKKEIGDFEPDGIEPSVFAVGDTEFDLVNKPKHYQLLPGVEVRDVIKVLVSKIADKGVLTEMQISDYVQMMQYLLRFMEKGGVEDIKKAKVYLEWILEEGEGDE